MMISTKGRYALRVMLDLAQCPKGEFIPLKTIAQRQEISQKYLESIVCILSKHNLVEGASGKGGGYRLCKTPEEYFVSDILKVMEGSLAPVACIENTGTCNRSSFCPTLTIWKGLNKVINTYFDNMTLKDAINPISVAEKVNQTEKQIKVIIKNEIE